MWGRGGVRNHYLVLMLEAYFRVDGDFMLEKVPDPESCDLEHHWLRYKLVNKSFNF